MTKQTVEATCFSRGLKYPAKHHRNPRPVPAPPVPARTQASLSYER